MGTGEAESYTVAQPGLELSALASRVLEVQADPTHPAHLVSVGDSGLNDHSFESFKVICGFLKLFVGGGVVQSEDNKGVYSLLSQTEFKSPSESSCRP